MRTRSGKSTQRDSEDDLEGCEVIGHVGGKAPKPLWKRQKMIREMEEEERRLAHEDESGEGGHTSDDEIAPLPKKGKDVAGAVQSGTKRGKIRVKHGNSREALRWSAEKAKIVIKYGVTTGVVCPCQMKSCRQIIRVGKYAQLATGSDLCVHCGTSRKDGSNFRHASDLLRHINGMACCRARGLEPKKVNARVMLGIHLRHIVNAPENYVTEKSGNGVKERFKCPQCKELRAWSKRYIHAKDCFPKHGVPLPGNEDEAVSEGSDQGSDNGSDQGSGQKSGQGSRQGRDDGSAQADDGGRPRRSGKRVVDVTDDDTEDETWSP